MTDRPAAEAAGVAQTYYDSEDADAFYRLIWGGEDIHVGLYEETDDIAAASARTVAHMARRLRTLGPGSRVLDLGAGYGGAARRLAHEYGASVVCLNLSEVENARNRTLNAEQGLSGRIEVIHGAFEDVPLPDESVDIVWSQDAFLHSGDRARVLAEIDRVLKPGGEVIFTDPMQADDLEDTGALQPIYDRLHLSNLASFQFYRSGLSALGLEEIAVEPLTRQLVRHYARVAETLNARRAQIGDQISEAYVERMLAGLGRWVRAGREGLLAWGVIHYRKP